MIIYCFTIGKEEIGVALAKHFNTKIVLNKKRYKMICEVNFFPEFFTLKKN